jgi:hypothetical protein
VKLALLAKSQVPPHVGDDGNFYSELRI